MALGRTNGNDNHTNLVFIRDISSKSEKAEEFEGKKGVPYFQVTKKVGDNWEPVLKVDRFSGRLKSVSTALRYDETKERDAANIAKFGNPFVVKVELEDPEAGETYVWKTQFTMIARGVLNSLLNVNLGENIEIAIGKKKSGYDAFFPRRVGEADTIPWKFSLDEQPKAKETTFKGKIMRDYTEVDEFYVKQINDVFGGKVAPAAQKPNPTPQKTTPPVGVDDGLECDEPHDEIPF